MDYMRLKVCFMKEQSVVVSLPTDIPAAWSVSCWRAFGVHEVIEETLVQFLYTTVDQAAPTCLMPQIGWNMVFIESTHCNKPNVTFSRQVRCVVLIAPGVVVVSTDKLAFERKPFEWASQSLSADLLVSTSSILSFPSVMSPRMGRMSSCPWVLCGSLRRRLWRQMKHCFIAVAWTAPYTECSQKTASKAVILFARSAADWHSSNWWRCLRRLLQNCSFRICMMLVSNGCNLEMVSLRGNCTRTLLNSMSGWVVHLSMSSRRFSSTHRSFSH